ncbi:regulatory protein RecX [Marinicella sp. S1101]|uniref:regulatory protein RecX n=1 Tax=Marinicella marina TaxID=2996016 RepID=UPI002260DBFF|nr:regulatory protein RecX [Marinicella marina]MCX7554078.1 regulatory protein RecX [Marinicella marina]MDJ1141229.1 regulatory protein RecX [Marinicella marina]
MAAEKKYTPEARARASALGSLAMREHSCQELKDKLINKKHDERVVDALMIDLLEDNLVSDLRFAESYWRARSNRGYGPSRINRELAMKGVSSEKIETALQTVELDFYLLVEQVYEKKYRGEPWHDYKEKAKRQAFLYRRGFDNELIRHVID